MALILSKSPKEKVDRPTREIPDQIITGPFVESYIHADTVLAAQEMAEKTVSRNSRPKNK